MFFGTYGCTFWTVQAGLEIPNFEELFDSFLEIVAKSEVILRLEIRSLFRIKKRIENFLNNGIGKESILRFDPWKI